MTLEKIDPKIEEGWKKLLRDEFDKQYFHDLREFLKAEKAKYTVYPPGQCIFSAFDLTPPGNLRVVILGQDPYHGPCQAHGLCFSVKEGTRLPPSLVNIFKELNQDLSLPIPNHGNLSAWARQGVLLLNATLTVRAGQPLSHQGKGWELFTNAVIKKISSDFQGIIFLLWGRHAQEKETLIDKTRHHILKAAHPSPLSAYNGFLGCKHFSKANEILNNQGLEVINWDIGGGSTTGTGNLFTVNQ